MTFDPKVIGFERLVTHASQSDCVAPVFAKNDRQLDLAMQLVGDQVKRAPGEMRPDDDPKHYLAQTPLRHVPMTAAQAARVNAEVHRTGMTAALAWLSPRQLARLQQVRAKAKVEWPVVIGRDLIESWYGEGR